MRLDGASHRRMDLLKRSFKWLLETDNECYSAAGFRILSRSATSMDRQWRYWSLAFGIRDWTRDQRLEIRDRGLRIDGLPAWLNRN